MIARLPLLVCIVIVFSPLPAVGAEEETDPVNTCTCQNASSIDIDKIRHTHLPLCRDLLLMRKEAAALSEADQASCVAVARNIQRKIEKTDETLQGSPLRRGFQHIEKQYFKFGVGYEYSSINELFSQGFPRINLTLYRKYNDWFHLSGSFILTSSAEQTVTTDATGAESDESKRTLEVNVEPFLGIRFFETEVFGQGESAIRDKLGLLILVGGRKTDEMEKIETRRYIGLRNIINPEWYFDVLFGKTEGLQSRRLELRGQRPIASMTRDSALYVGAIANLSIEDRENGPDRDVVRIYISWEYEDFMDFFKKK